MRVFTIIRQADESGVSGTGRVLDGIVFDDGTTVVRWRTATASTAIYKTYEDFYYIHIESHPDNLTIIEEQEVEL